ncbi:MAG: cell wall hydrolase [Lachnospiraceae bacterium]|nr:cell wall hydrolase [Lachnospiraceae bacterium]
MMNVLPTKRIFKSAKARRGCRAAISGMLAPVLALTLVLAGRFNVNATTQQQIDQAQHEKEELQAQQQANQNALDDLKTEQGELQVKVNELNGQLEEIGDNLQTLEQGMIDKQAEIEATRIALEEAIATEEWQYECMVIRVRDMYERGDQDFISAILGAKSLSEMLTAADFFEKIESYDQKKLEEFKANRAFIEEQKARLELEEAELESLKQQTVEQQNMVSGIISETRNVMSVYADQIEDAEAAAIAYEAAIKAKEADIAYLKQKLAEEQALSRAAANGVWRDISQVTWEENDRYLLANLIYCEAGGEPYDGQVAVGAVVINRLLSARYPDTLTGVIYQRGQFSPAGSGRLAIALAQNKATSSCYRAADEAMSGVTNVGTCVYFRTPIEGLTGIQIGHHIFY